MRQFAVGDELSVARPARLDDTTDVHVHLRRRLAGRRARRAVHAKPSACRSSRLARSAARPRAWPSDARGGARTQPRRTDVVTPNPGPLGLPPSAPTSGAPCTASRWRRSPARSSGPTPARSGRSDDRRHAGRTVGCLPRAPRGSDRRARPSQRGCAVTRLASKTHDPPRSTSPLSA